MEGHKKNIILLNTIQNLWKRLPGFRLYLSLFLFLNLILLFPLSAQTSDDNYRVPLEELLGKIESTFSITLKYSSPQVENRYLDYGEWKIQPYDLEKTLARVLYPFDLDYVKESEGVYKIKSYEYPRRTVEEGRQFLEYLTKLYDDKPSWEKRKKELKECMWQALGLDPLPEKPDSKPIVTTRRKMNGYTIENVAIETLPGLYVAGSLYRPLKQKGLSPVILNPNGHFGDGRYRADMQIRCAMQARMGAIAFSYDLFAWGESLLQFKPEDHRRSIAQTVQALNSIRLLDYLLSLEGADPDRVAITGGSGGGSQAMVIAALDDRIKVSVPVVMTASHFSGGCPCESGRPIHLCGGGTNNAEIAAMAAPKPQLILSDGKDWTHSVPDLEYSFIQRTYGFYDKNENVKNVHFPAEGHDYGTSKRLAAYEFMAEHLGLDLNKIKNRTGRIDESLATIEPYESLYVFGKNGERLPEDAIKNIEELYRVFEKVR